MQTFYTNDQQYSGIFWTQDASSATDCIDSLLSSIESRVHDIYSIERNWTMSKISVEICFQPY